MGIEAVYTPALAFRTAEANWQQQHAQNTASTAADFEQTLSKTVKDYEEMQKTLEEEFHSKQQAQAEEHEERIATALKESKQQWQEEKDAEVVAMRTDFFQQVNKIVEDSAAIVRQWEKEMRHKESELSAAQELSAALKQGND